MPSIGKIGSPPTTAAPVATDAAGAAATAQASASSFQGKSVRADTDAGRITLDLRQLSGSRRDTPSTAKPGAADFTNRASDTLNKADAQRVGRLRRLGGRVINGLRKLIRQVLPSRARTAGTQTAKPAATATTASPAQQMPEIMRDAARRGIDGTRQILNQRILGNQHSTDDVLARLTTGDTGIRRATTAVQNLMRQLTPQDLPEESLNGTRDQWRSQTREISKMAKQIGEAKFSGEADWRFLDYGTTGAANPFNAVAEKHPKLDHPVRNWLSDGVNLLDRLLQAQERAFNKQPPLDEDEMASLKKSVAEFSDAVRSDDLSAFDIDVGSLSSEVMAEFEEKMEQLKKT